MSSRGIEESGMGQVEAYILDADHNALPRIGLRQRYPLIGWDSVNLKSG